MAKVMVSLNLLSLHSTCMPLDLLWLSLCYSDMTWLKIILFLFWFPFLFFLSALSVLHGTIWCFQISVILQALENPSIWQGIYFLAGISLWPPSTEKGQVWPSPSVTESWRINEEAKKFWNGLRCTPKPLGSAGLLLARSAIDHSFSCLVDCVLCLERHWRSVGGVPWTYYSEVNATCTAVCGSKGRACEE